jgi:hypothetical protein
MANLIKKLMKKVFKNLRKNHPENLLEMMQKTSIPFKGAISLAHP